MIRQQVIVTILTISRIGQRVYFQIKLPKDATRIIGVEYSVFGMHTVNTFFKAALKPSPPVNIFFNVVSNDPIGRLTLLSPGNANIFFQADIIDYSNIHLYHEITAFTFPPTPWSHSGKSEEWGVDVDGDVAIIEGNFKDGRAADSYDGFEYNLHVYLWIEKLIS